MIRRWILELFFRRDLDRAYDLGYAAAVRDARAERERQAKARRKRKPALVVVEGGRS